MAPAAIGASAVAGIVIASLLWSDAADAGIVPWAAALLMALAVRIGVRQAHAGRPEDPQRWRFLYRLSFLLHGLAWGALPVMAAWKLDHELQDAVLVVLMAMVGGSLVSSAYDRVAALLFSAPVLVPLYLSLAGFRTEPQLALGAAVTVFLAAMWLAASRSSQALFGAVRAQQAAAERANDAEQARRALAEQHHLLSTLMRSTSQGYWFIDVAGLTVDLNQAMCRLLGRSREEVLGRSARSFIVPDDLPVLDAALEARRRGEVGSYEVRLQRPDGSQWLCHNNATPLFDIDGHSNGSVGLWTDLSAHQAAERELRAYQLVVNSMVDPVSVVDEDLRYRLVNDAWCRTTGMQRAQAVGSSTDEALGGRVPPERVVALQECIDQQQLRVVRSPVYTAALEGRLIETRYHPYRDDDSGLRCVAMVSRDITEEVRASEALGAVAEDLRRTLNATGDAIFASDAQDPHQPVRFINERMLAMWGLPRDAGATVTPADILAVAAPLFQEPEQELARIGDIVAHNLHDERRLALRDGRVLLRRCMPAEGPHGTVRVWSFRDITVEDQAVGALRDSEARQRALLGAFPGYIAAFDQDFRYTYVNGRFAQLMGREIDDVLGRSMEEVVGEERFLTTYAVLTKALDGEQHRSERSYPARDGRPPLDLEITHVAGPPGPDGKRICYGFGVDITARKRAEEALLAARDLAEQASRAKSQFLAHMSHELRTPLNAIIGFTELLQTDPALALGETEHSHLREIANGGHHLLELINELLDLGRIESGQLVVEHTAVPLAELFEECLAFVRGLAAQRGLRVLPAPALAAGAALLGDRMRVKQVLLNLLGNAVKYNRPSGEIELRCEAVAGRWRIEVRDGGHGLDEAQASRLFTPFERLDAADRGIEGTGIGLALSRHLVQAMGGTIGIDSQPGVGSRFWFSLPAAERRAPALRRLSGPSAARAPDDAPRRRVLYVEDNAVNTLLMQAMLARVPGVLLQCVDHPVEGLKAAQVDPPALVLLDLQLPGIDGFEVFARLRAHEATCGVPVVAVSADGSGASIEAARVAGFAAYLTKPLDLSRLLATVKRLLDETPVQPR